MHLISVILLILFSVVGLVTSLPVDPSGSCVPFTGTQCKQFFSPTDMIYVNSTHNMSALDSAATSTIALSLVLPEGDCKTIAVRYGCLRIYRVCDTGAVPNISLAVPKQPCFNICSEFAEFCNPVLLRFGQPAYICPNDTSYDINGTTYIPTCEIGKTLNRSCNGTKVASCPNPAFFVPDDKCGCSLRCPFPVHTVHRMNRNRFMLMILFPIFGICLSDFSSDWLVLEVLLAVLSWLGTFLCAIVAATYLIDRKRLKYPGWVVFNLALANMLWHLAGTITSWNGRWRNLSCKNGWTVKHSRFCAFQAVVMTYMGNTAPAWWLVHITIIGTMILPPAHISERISRFLAKHWYIPVIYGWGFGIIFTVLMIPHQGPMPIAPFCIGDMGFDPKKFGFADTRFIERYYVIPTAVQAGLGAPIWIAINLKLIWILHVKSHGVSSISLWKVHARPLIMALVEFWPFFIFVVSYYILKPRFHAYTRELAECFASNPIGCDRAFPFAGPLWFMIGLNLQGALLFLVYGLQKKNWRLWRGVIGGVVSRISGATTTASTSTPDRSATPQPSLLTDSRF